MKLRVVQEGNYMLRLVVFHPDNPDEELAFVKLHIGDNCISLVHTEPTPTRVFYNPVEAIAVSIGICRDLVNISRDIEVVDISLYNEYNYDKNKIATFFEGWIKGVNNYRYVAPYTWVAKGMDLQ